MNEPDRFETMITKDPRERLCLFSIRANKDLVRYKNCCYMMQIIGLEPFSGLSSVCWVNNVLEVTSDSFNDQFHCQITTCIIQKHYSNLC